MRKTLLFLAVLILLGLMTYWWVIRAEDSTFGKQASSFTIDNPDIIDAIKIVDKDGRILNLKRFNDTKTWTVNGRFIAREDATEQLFLTLQKMKIYAPVPKAARANVMESLTQRPRSVELFSKGKLHKHIIMSGTTLNQKGTYMMLAEEKEPYIVYIPGFNGHLLPRFFSEEKDWRSHKVFNHEAKDIQKIKIDYSKKTEDSFALIRNEQGKMELENDSNFDPLVVADYLQRFQKINVEAYDNKLSFKDSILAETPLCIIELTDLNQQTNKITIYPMFINERSKMMFDAQGNPQKYDRDRYYATLNEERDFAVIQDFVFGPLFATKNSFLQKTNTTKQ